MSYRLRIRAAAERDIAKAQKWYDGQRPGLGAEFRGEVGRIVDQLASNPLMYPVVYPRLRRAIVRRFPYLLYFVVEGEQVHVVACLHGHHGPSALTSRLR